MYLLFSNKSSEGTLVLSFPTQFYNPSDHPNLTCMFNICKHLRAKWVYFTDSKSNWLTRTILVFNKCGKCAFSFFSQISEYEKYAQLYTYIAGYCVPTTESLFFFPEGALFQMYMLLFVRLPWFHSSASWGSWWSSSMHIRSLSSGKLMMISTEAGLTAQVCV